MNMDFTRLEIGSEFWDVPTSERVSLLWPLDTQWFISGTSALEYIICDLQKCDRVERVGIPAYCCSCMIQPFVDAGLTVVQYPVYVDSDSGLLTCDYEVTSDCDATLVMSYFGYDQLETIGNPGGIIIRDLTHSLFCRDYDDAQYYFGSLRKWAGLWTGGYAWKKDSWSTLQQIVPADIIYLQRRADAMAMKVEYLMGTTDKKEYLHLFEESEEFLDQCGILGSCERDIDCARRIDAGYIRTRRRENAQVLLDALKNIALFPEIRGNDCPMFVPIILPSKEVRNRLRGYLTAHEIYCPIHWPISSLHVLGAKERELYDCALSIVCDQRYNVEDMRRIVDTIRMFGEI